MKNKIFYLLPISLIILSTLSIAITVEMFPTYGIDTSDGTYNLNSDDLAKLVASDNDRYKTHGRWNNKNYNDNDYLEFGNFSPQIPNDATINNVTIYFEWQRTSSCQNLKHARLRVWDYSAGSWVDNEFATMPPVGHDRTEVIDASSYITSPEELNNIKLWFQGRASPAPGGYTKHDLVKMVVDLSIDCSSFTTEFECLAYDEFCDWCPSCSGNQWSGFESDRCVNEGECSYSCYEGQCGAECDEEGDYEVEGSTCYYRCDPFDSCTYTLSCSLENYCKDNTRYYNGECSASGCSFESEDCSQYNHYDDWEYYCSEDEVWRHRLYHEFTCSPDECEDNPYYTDEELVEDCNSLDGWYSTDETRWVDIDQCNEKQQRKEEYRDYYCSDASCEYVITNTRWVDTGITQQKPDGTSCDDGLFCTINDVCVAGVCEGEERSCDDGIDCTIDSCDENLDTCIHDPHDELCDDGLFCNGAEWCSVEEGCQPGEPVDCSAYDQDEIATCFWDPDGIDYTWDYAPAFTSYCDEDLDACVEFDPSTITHECSVELCGAECDSTHACIDKCVGDLRYYGGSCLNNCTCSYEIENCDSLDGWYTTDETRWIDVDQCNEKEQIKREYRDYYCSEGDEVICDYIVTDEEWVDTGATRPKPDGTSCDDGLFCTINDVCSDGVCVGEENPCDDGIKCTVDSCNEDLDTCVHEPNDEICDDGLYCNGEEYCDPSLGCQPGEPIDCSPYDLPEIATCDYSPDDNPYTWDYAPAFTSYCDEDLDACVEGEQTLTHTCSIALCGAECESDEDCPANSCEETYYDYCDGHRLVEYDNDKTLDSTTVSDECENTCNDCLCTDCEVDCSPPPTNSYCVFNVCGAECDSLHDCEPKLENDICYYNGVCSDDCLCSYESELCPEPGSVIDGICYWGERSCEEEGCIINASSIRDCEVCDPQIGPTDYEGPVVFNISIDRVCKMINISAIAEDCSNIEEAEFFLNVDKCPPTDVRGEPLYPKDGAFDEETEEIYRNYVNIDTLSDGRHTLYIRAKDEHGTWGECYGYGFNVDTIGPTTDELNLTNLVEDMFVCGDGSVEVKALICDFENQSIITNAEYLLDDFTIPNGEGFPMQPSDGAWDDYCEYVSGEIDVSGLEEGTHYVGVHGEDAFCNWGKIVDKVSFIKDTIAPTTTKEVGEPKIACDYYGDGEADDCWIITQNTPIMLEASDYDPGDGEYSGNPEYGGYVTTYCRFRWKYDFDDEWSEWSEPEECNGTFTLSEDSIHEIEYWSVDACGNEEEHHFEILIVDSTPPVTSKEVGEPKIEGEGFIWITQDTQITLTCEDQQPHPSGEVTIHWRYAIDGEWNDWSEEHKSSVTIKFNEDSNHTLEYYCVDALGNEEEHHVQYYKVDSTPPITAKTYGEPFYNNGTHDFGTSETLIYLNASDQGCDGGVGVDYTEYRIGNGEWQIYENPFTIEEEGMYRICFKSIDLLGNEETKKCQYIIIDNTPPTTTKTISGNKCFNGTHYIIDSSSLITLNSIDGGEIPVGVYKVYYRYCSGVDACSGEWQEYVAPFSISGLPDGFVRIEWYSEDYLGNIEEVKYEIDVLDNTPPTTRIVFPENGTTYATDFDVIIEDEDACLASCNAKCYYRINGGEWQERECNAPVHIDINETNYPGWCCEKCNVTIEAYAIDCLNHEGEIDKATYIIDRFWPPEIREVSPFGTVETSEVELRVVTNKVAMCKFDVQSKAFENMAYTMETEDGFVHTYHFDYLKDGYYVYYVRCSDEVGNKMLQSEAIAFYVNTANNYNLTIPRQGYFATGWNYFVLPRIILEDIGITDYSVDNILASLQEDGEWKYEVLFYYDGNEWRSYVPGEPMNTLTEFIDNENRPYWIKIKPSVDDARIELG